MREIKFKVWDTVKNEWVRHIYAFSPHFIHAAVSTSDGSKWIDIREFFVLQFTGIKDKNGKEIYEGDIVRIIGDSMWKHEGIYKVGYDRGSFNLIHQSLTMGVRTLIDLDFNLIEVLGNIHETPKLIK